jgi:hypothetical protein
MTRDDIIRWARQAGIKLPDGAFPDQGSFTLPNLIQFAAIVAAAERKRLCDAAERCRMCEQKGVRHEQTKGDETD